MPLGQKFLEIVAQQPLNLSEGSILRRNHRIKLFVSGIETALLSAAPLVSMIASSFNGAPNLNNFGCFLLFRSLNPYH